MSKYTHYITIPVATSFCIAVESDTPLGENNREARKAAYDMAMNAPGIDHARWKVEDAPEIEIGEEVSYLSQIVEGNISHAPINQVEWYTETDESEDAEG